MKLSELVETYVFWRDEKSKLKAEYDTAKQRIESKLDAIEAALLKTFDSAGLDSIKTTAGTAYTSTQTQASVVDPDAFFTYVKNEEAWHLMEKRCSKSAVEQFKQEHNDLPPGINWREERVVNVRRSA